MKFNHSQFLFLYQETIALLNNSQSEGLIQLLDFIEHDPYIVDIRWASYELATTKWECGDTWKPIHERGGNSYFINRYGSQTKVGKVLGNDTPEEGAIYAGKGYTQTTGENNSEMLEKVLPREYPDVIARWEAVHGRKFDLTVGDQPNDAQDNMTLLDPEIAYINMSVCMRKGLYTGVGLPKYFNDKRDDPLNARKIINRLDQAEKIAGFHNKILFCLKETQV